MTRAATPFGDAGHDYRGIAKLSRARYSGVSVIIIRSVLPLVPLLSLQSSRERGRYPLQFNLQRLLFFSTTKILFSIVSVFSSLYVSFLEEWEEMRRASLIRKQRRK